MHSGNTHALMGSIFQGWGGIIAGLALCLLAVIIAFALYIMLVYLRAKSRINRIYARLQPLSDEQLSEITRNPTHPDSQFALVELMRRGVDVPPPKDQLFDMLTSGDPTVCGNALVNLQMFYPEIVIPNGASNHDTPEMWKSRVEEFRRTG